MIPLKRTSVPLVALMVLTLCISSGGWTVIRKAQAEQNGQLKILESSRNIVMKEKRNRGSVPVKPITKPSEITGAGLTAESNSNTARQITRMAKRKRNYGRVDVESLNDLLTTKHFFTKVASLAGGALKDHSVGNTVSLGGGSLRLSNLDDSTFTLSNSDLDDLSANSDIDVSSIGPDSSVRFLRSVTIGVRQNEVALQVGLP